MRIALIRLSAIGDIVFSLVAAALVKQKFAQAKITWVVDERFYAVVENSPFVDEIITLQLKPLTPKNVANAIKKLKEAGEFDLLIDMQGLIKSALVSSFIAAKQKVGFSYKSAREPLASLFYKTKAKSPYQKNIIERYIDLLNASFGGGFSVEEAREKPRLLGHSKAAAIGVDGKKTILINPLASKANKIYPKEKMDIVAKAFGGENVITLEHGKDPKTLDEIKALISACDLVVGGDTGITHMAWAQNVPSVTIFGATPYERNAFATKKNIMIAAKSGVDAKKLDYNDFSIADIDPNVIVKAARSLL